MRILFLTNFYPPYELGGQGLSCQQVVESLQQRGHHTLVLTSLHGTNNRPVKENGIYRWLYLEMDFVPWHQSLSFFMKRKEREKHNLHRLKRALEQFEPDIIFIWGMWNLPWSLAALAEARCAGRVVYRFADYWPTLPSQHELYWRASGRNWFVRLPKQILGYIALKMLAKGDQRPLLKFEHAICVSAATRDILVEAGIPVANARIIYTGLDVKQYLTDNRQCYEDKNSKFALLYAGRLASEKGIDTALKAIAKLVHSYGLKNIKLSLAGSGSTDYQNHLKSIMTQEGLTEFVSFLGHIPRVEMPALLRKVDVLLVPSVWPEPFARVLLEGMISGLVVVATPTGGTGEIVSDGKNGLLFTPGDADNLAQKIVTLISDRELCRKLAQAGRQMVMKRFTVHRMLDEIESYLQEVASHSASENTAEKLLV